MAKLDRPSGRSRSSANGCSSRWRRLDDPSLDRHGSFDLMWHLRRVNSPAPHTPDTVLAIARVAAMTAFDRARPLWEFTLVEHLEGDRAALVMKVHHSLTDGLGGMQSALLLFDVDPNPTALEPVPTEPTGGRTKEPAAGSAPAGS